MKITSIVPGFGGTFYCGNCLRDSAFSSALRKAGHQATLLPVYLPLSLDRQKQETPVPIFYGAVNLYLKQQFPVMRNMPHWVEKLLDSRPLLNLAAKKSGSTRADGLEAMTESMLQGPDGLQHKELETLVDFLKNHEKPDVVHLSNALLLGMASRIKEAGIPVVCSLQDEDVWIDAMEPSGQEKMWRLMAEKAQAVDSFVAVSRYFGQLMQEKMEIPSFKLHTVPIGIDPGAYHYHPPVMAPRTIGYLSRFCKENGFDIVIDSFILLKKEPQFSDLRLAITGGMTGDDRSCFHNQMARLKSNHLLKDLTVFHDFGAGTLDPFFQELTVLSVPVLKGEAFGLYQIEALASGIPTVQPALGAFPEIAEETGGGVIYQPNTPEALAEKLSEILSNPEALVRLSLNGRRAVEEKFDSEKLAMNLIKIYKSLIFNN